MSLVVEHNESADPVDVHLFGPSAVVPRANRLSDPIEQLRCGRRHETTMPSSGGGHKSSGSTEQRLARQVRVGETDAARARATEFSGDVRGRKKWKNWRSEESWSLATEFDHRHGLRELDCGRYRSRLLSVDTPKKKMSSRCRPNETHSHARTRTAQIITGRSATVAAELASRVGTRL